MRSGVDSGWGLASLTFTGYDVSRDQQAVSTLREVLQSGISAIVDGLFVTMDAEGKTDYLKTSEFSQTQTFSN